MQAVCKKNMKKNATMCKMVKSYCLKKAETALACSLRRGLINDIFIVAIYLQEELKSQNRRWPLQ